MDIIDFYQPEPTCDNQFWQKKVGFYMKFTHPRVPTFRVEVVCSQQDANVLFCIHRVFSGERVLVVLAP